MNWSPTSIGRWPLRFLKIEEYSANPCPDLPPECDLKNDGQGLAADMHIAFRALMTKGVARILKPNRGKERKCDVIDYSLCYSQRRS
jgi:hypothetical protein